MIKKNSGCVSVEAKTKMIPAHFIFSCYSQKPKKFFSSGLAVQTSSPSFKLNTFPIRNWEDFFFRLHLAKHSSTTLWMSTHASRPDQWCRSRRPRCIQCSQVGSWISLPCPDLRGSGEWRSSSQRARNPWHRLVLIHIKACLCWRPVGVDYSHSVCDFIVQARSCTRQLPATGATEASLPLKYLHLF